MLTKTQPDEIQSFLSDASYLTGGQAISVVFPENAEEAAAVLALATRDKTPVTISGAGTGTVGGRVPSGGIILASDKLNQIKHIDYQASFAVAEPGVILRDLQFKVESKGLLYPPDPTERGCFLGGTVATNASGARTFKYGPTRNYVKRLKIALATGEILDLRRGDLLATASGEIRIPLSSGRVIEAVLPSYQMPRVRKHATGYFVAPEMDLLDLFIGSEGTLGVIVEIELKLLPKPEGVLSGVVFFASEPALLEFVREARERSLETRKGVAQTSDSVRLDARAIEFFDNESLGFLRQKYDTIPATAVGAIFFEQETTAATEDPLMDQWLSLLEKHQALGEESWFATNEPDQVRLREFRHALPVLMNEWFAHHKQRKVSTDMSVPDDAFPGMLRFYQDTLRKSDLRYTIFGHIGDNHVHVNILPRNDDEGARAREIYLEFLKRAASVGGTLSAEHGIGKLKRDYLPLFYTETHLREMAALKSSFDPAGILGRGNIFSEEYL
jgi:D-lactate dehydrogenase (cytochrome)